MEEGYSNTSKHKIPDAFDLRPDEEVIWSGKRSWKSMIGSIIGIIISFFVLLIIAVAIPPFILFALLVLIFGLLGVVIRVLATEYVITNKRVASKFGLISRKTNEASFERIQDTSLNQGWGGRLLDYGDLGIRTAGTKGTEINFNGVSGPMKIQRRIRDLIGEYEKDKEIEERIKRFEDKYLLGEITEEELEKAKRNLRNWTAEKDPSRTGSPTSTPSRSTRNVDTTSRVGNSSTNQSPPPPPKKEDICSDCGSEMRYIEQYERWYCDECQEYK